MSALYTAVATADGRNGHTATPDGRIDLKLAYPPALGGDGEGSNPEQLFAAGYAACFAGTIHAIGRESKTDTSGVSVTANIGIGKDDTDGGFALSALLQVTLPQELRNEAGHNLVEQAHTACPYSKATRGNIPVEIVIWIPPWIPQPSGWGGNGLLRSRAREDDAPPGRIVVHQ